jgi:tetratricopeptide (TPR) repeat protein
MSRYILPALLCLLVSGHSFAQSGKTATQYYQDGLKLKEQKKYAEAVTEFSKAIGIKADYTDALFYAGWCAIELQRYDDALTYLNKARALGPNEPRIYIETGYAQEKSGKKEEAKQNYLKCISLKNDYALAHKYLGFLYYDEQDYTTALKYLTNYFFYEPDITSDEFFFRKGYCENELGKYQDAIASLNKANEIYAKDASTYNELGYAYQHLDNAEEAIKNYRKGMELNPKSVVATNGIAEVYRDLKKDYTEAISHYQKTLAIDAKNKKANYWTGWCYNELEKYSDAVAYLKKAIEADNKYVSAITELGYSYYAQGRYEDALAEFKTSIGISKTELNLYYAGLCHAAKKQKAEALKYYDELLKMKSEYAEKLKKKTDTL